MQVVRVEKVPMRQRSMGLRCTGTGNHVKAKIIAEQLFQKLPFSLIERYTLNSKSFGIEIMNEIAGVPGS